MEGEMHTSVSSTLSRSVSIAILGVWIALGVVASASANVITDWDEKALVVVAPMASLGGTSPYMAQRMMGIVHIAMRRGQFDRATLPTVSCTAGSNPDHLEGSSRGRRSSRGTGDN
jgi:hypothetical protein